MSKIIEAINNLNIDDEKKQWILEKSDGFKFQFHFYHCKLGHSFEKSINRAISEIDEINTEKDYRINEILNDHDLNDTQKIETIKDLYFD